MYCRKCGADVGNAKFCPECGAKVGDSKEAAIQDVVNQFSMETSAPKRYKKPILKRWYFWVIVIFVVLIAAASRIGNNVTSNTSPSAPVQSQSGELSDASSEELLAFDDKTWPQFIELYKAHATLISNIQAVADGTASILALYQYCEDAEAYFRDMSLAFDYGEADYQREYLSAFKSMALYDQMAVEKLMDYLDSYETSDLSAASDYLSNAVTAATLIASNRGTLLASTDLTEDEIQQKIEESTAALEQ